MLVIYFDYFIIIFGLLGAFICFVRAAESPEADDHAADEHSHH
jgi:hypothetical protein